MLQHINTPLLNFGATPSTCSSYFSESQPREAQAQMVRGSNKNCEKQEKELFISKWEELILLQTLW
jgi:hypothetical protein